MKLSKLAGATSEIWQLFIQDSSSSTGAGLTGLVFNSGSLTAYYHRDTDTTATAITLVTMTVGTFTSSGFKEIDATNMPGWYQFCPPNAAIASGAKSCGFHLKGASNMAPLPIEVQLTAVNPDSATAFITGVNSVAPPTNWNLTSIDASGRLDIIKIAGTTQTARDIGASVLLSSGTGTGQLDFTSGVVKSNLTQILGTAASAPATAGILEVNVKNINNQATSASGTITFPNATLASTTNITAGTITTVTNLTNAATSGDLTATMKTSVTTAATASTPALSSAGNNAVADALLARTLGTESYAAQAAVPTVAQAFFMMLSNAPDGQFSISGTTITCKKLDGSTTSMTYTLNDASNPTSKIRST